MPVAETRDVQMYVDTDAGWVESAVTFKAAPSSKNLLSIGKLLARGFKLRMSEEGPIHRARRNASKSCQAGQHIVSSGSCCLRHRALCGTRD